MRLLRQLWEGICVLMHHLRISNKIVQIFRCPRPHAASFGAVHAVDSEK